MHPEAPAEVIDRMAEAALSEIRAMVGAALLKAGYSIQFIHRSRGQRARFERARQLKQGERQ